MLQSHLDSLLPAYVGVPCLTAAVLACRKVCCSGVLSFVALAFEAKKKGTLKITLLDCN